MTLRMVTPPTVEPMSVAEALFRAHITSTAQEPPPGAITAAIASPAAPGNVDNGAHRYLATFVTADGETEAGTVSSAVTIADKTVNGRVTLTNIPLGGTGVTSRKLYRTAANGSTYLLLATLADNTTTTYSDNVADASLGAGAPSVNTTSNPYFLSMIKGARNLAEARTGRRLITQVVEQVYDAFPSSEMQLGVMPVQGIEFVKYYDTDGVLQTMDAGDYVLDQDTLKAWLLPVYGTNWPSTRASAMAVIIRMTVGYGDTGADVPDEFKQYMISHIVQWHRAPGGYFAGSATPIPGFDHLIDDYDIRDIA